MSPRTPSVAREATDDTHAARDTEPRPPAYLPLAAEIVGVEKGWQRLEGIEASISMAVTAVGSHPRVAPFLPAEACIALSTDADVRILNRAWRAKDTPTNVLSFPTPPGQPVEDGVPPFVGDVVLALETIIAEAADLDIPIRNHVQHLVVHGLLHLFGFDHEEASMAREMETIETQVLASIAVPDPYAGTEPEDSSS